MGRLILLDAGVIGLPCSSPALQSVRECIEWLDARGKDGDQIQNCELSEFEVRRESIRIKATSKLRRLDDLGSILEVLLVSLRAWIKAADFWAVVRQAGMPTADSRALDADVILAGVAATIGGMGDEVMIATSNDKHLGRFPGVDARPWEAIA